MKKVYINMNKKIFLIGLYIILILFSSCLNTAQEIKNNNIADNFETRESERFFLYIPDYYDINDYIGMYQYLKAWDNNDISVSNEDISNLFKNHLGKDTIQSLLFESFLRYTKNKDIQKIVLDYINKNNIDTGFSDSLKKLYSAVPVTTKVNSKDVIQYNYNNAEFDENINLFSFGNMALFNREVSAFIFNNEWDVLRVNNNNSKNEESFMLTYGGGTNSLLLSFRKYMNLDEKNIDTKFNLDLYKGRYKNNWQVVELPKVNILSQTNADRIFIASGYGPEVIETIESAAFIIYLYDKKSKTLYEANYYMNFSPINIHYSERDRIYNFLFFQLLFVNLIK